MKLSPADADAIRQHVYDALDKVYGPILGQNFLLKNQLVQRISHAVEQGFNRVNGDRDVPYTVHGIGIFPKKIQIRWIMGQARGGVTARRITREDVRSNPKFLSSFVEPTGYLALELDKLEKMKQYL